MSLAVKHSKEEASKEHPKPPSSVIDLDSDEDIMRLRLKIGRKPNINNLF
jgi:hypothetical protein